MKKFSDEEIISIVMSVGMALIAATLLGYLVCKVFI